MERNYDDKLAQHLNLRTQQVEATRMLLDGGDTVPFIARYRKEATGTLDEVMVTAIRDCLHQWRELDKRRDAVLVSIKEQNKLTKSLEEKILAAQTMAVLEDLYLPYRPKRRTKATIAKEQGLEPLAKKIFAQEGVDPMQEAKAFVDAKKNVVDVSAALMGARYIIAEWMNEDGQARKELRHLFETTAVMGSKIMKGKEEEGAKYKDYFEWQEPIVKAPSHRILAVRRGEKEKFLIARVTVNVDTAETILKDLFVKGQGADAAQVELAIEDAFKRLLAPSLETEMRLMLKKRADAQAIEVFKNNLRELLMAAPLGRQRLMAIDPGFRTGCKVVCLDEQGKLLHDDKIYLLGKDEVQEKAASTIKTLVQRFAVQVIAIGNGTASRETLAFIKGLGLSANVPAVMASESGASIYSASEVARREFPDYDITVRGAVSIGRRLMDPLAELVKIDAKSIGVGQYQHDVDQRLLKQSLDDVVESCVNQVGVEVNTASKELLTYVSGLGPARAQAIIDQRNATGAFQSRLALKDVPGLGGKAFEQAVGFLRIRDGKNPLDASAVHVEAYPIVDQMLADVGITIQDVMRDEALRRQIDVKKYVTDAIGLPTLNDIMSELAKPGRDPRPAFEVFTYKEGVETLQDLEVGMELPGVITNITAFGAFVDIGVHQDGLLHISQMSDRFVKDPHQVVKVHQPITVRVLEVDHKRKRIALSARSKES